MILRLGVFHLVFLFSLILLHQVDPILKPLWSFVNLRIPLPRPMETVILVIILLLAPQAPQLVPVLIAVLDLQEPARALFVLQFRQHSIPREII